MAVYFRGMSPAELAAWTDAIIASGGRMDLSGLARPTVDKHSTGGVGDKVSLILAPLVAACGAAVPQLSGRGLGHTGGTLDKLESIPGWRSELTPEEIRRQLDEVGCVICAAGRGLAPADRKLYTLRDVTATVESIPLIAASIMSKKIAEGTAALVLDVKVGSGAFMTEKGRASELASTMVELGKAYGVGVVALLTAMDAPLGQRRRQRARGRRVDRGPLRGRPGRPRRGDAGARARDARPRGTRRRRSRPGAAGRLGAGTLPGDGRRPRRRPRRASRGRRSWTRSSPTGPATSLASTPAPSGSRPGGSVPAGPARRTRSARRPG